MPTYIVMILKKNILYIILPYVPKKSFSCCYVITAKTETFFWDIWYLIENGMKIISWSPTIYEFLIWTGTKIVNALLQILYINQKGYHVNHNGIWLRIVPETFIHFSPVNLWTKNGAGGFVEIVLANQWFWFCKSKI